MHGLMGLALHTFEGLHFLFVYFCAATIRCMWTVDASATEKYVRSPSGPLQSTYFDDMAQKESYNVHTRSNSHMTSDNFVCMCAYLLINIINCATIVPDIVPSNNRDQGWVSRRVVSVAIS